jgi:hypothetical protein
MSFPSGLGAFFKQESYVLVKKPKTNYMNRMLIFLSLFFVSCSSKDSGIKSIEVMSYRYISSNNTFGLHIKPLLFAKIDEYGDVQMEKDNGELNYYSFSIEKEYLNNFEADTKHTSGAIYHKNLDSVKWCVCDYPVFRVKIDYKNDKTLSFNFDENDPSEKFKSSRYLFYELIRKSKSHDNKTKQIKSIVNKRKDFVKFTMNKDTLQLPLPIKPNKKVKIKFTKP